MPDDSIDRLARLRAEISIGRYPYSDDLPGVACDALVAGIDTPTLRELAGVTRYEAHNSLVDCRALLARALEELGLDALPEDHARRELARFVSRDILDRRVDAFEGAHLIGCHLFLRFRYPTVENQLGCAMRRCESEGSYFDEDRPAMDVRVRHIAQIILGEVPNDLDPSIGRPMNVPVTPGPVPGQDNSPRSKPRGRRLPRLRR